MAGLGASPVWLEHPAALPRRSVPLPSSSPLQALRGLPLKYRPSTVSPGLGSVPCSSCRVPGPPGPLAPALPCWPSCFAVGRRLWFKSPSDLVFTPFGPVLFWAFYK